MGVARSTGRESVKGAPGKRGERRSRESVPDALCSRAGGPVGRSSRPRAAEALARTLPQAGPARRRHANRPGGFGPYSAPRGGVGKTPPAGAGGHHGQATAAFGHQVEYARHRDRRPAVIGDRDPRDSVARAINLDCEYAATPRGGMRDRVGAELGYARHERFPGRAASQQLSHEPAGLRHGRGRTPERPRPRTGGRSNGTGRSRGAQRKHWVSACHRRSPPDK